MEAIENIEENNSKVMLAIGGAVLALTGVIVLRKKISEKLNRTEDDIQE